MAPLRLLLVSPLLGAIILIGVERPLHAQPQPVAPEEAARWCDHLIPLPRKIAITGKRVVRRQDLAIRLSPTAGEVERQAASELRELLHTSTGAVPAGKRFEILLGVLDADGQIAGVKVSAAKKLESLAHENQAYLIDPSQDGKLIGAARGPAGVYYAAQTLKQLLAANLGEEEVQIPLAAIVDWPDLDERGLWNFDLDLIPWLTSLKMNFAKVGASPRTVQRGKPVQAEIASSKTIGNVLEAARLRAMHAVPIVAHLNYLGHHHGAYAAYPELAGKGDAAVPNCGAPSRDIRVPCASCPVLRTLIADYLSSLAAQGANEVSVWLSEHQAQCQCPTCLQAGQFRTETEAALAGWRAARERHPGLAIRVFYCFGGKSLQDTHDCLMSLPPEVKIEHCYGRFSQAFDACAAEGRWLATYAGPPLDAIHYSGMRFHALARTQKYIRSLSDRKWSGVYSINYVYSHGAHQKELYDLHVTALAEYSWNLGGRTSKDLARAWATRAGYAQPAQFAQWIELIEPVESAMAGTLASRLWEKVPDELRARQPGHLGSGLLAGFPTPERFDASLAACGQALVIAQGIGSQDLTLETRYTAASVRLLRLLAQMQAQAAARGAEERRQAVATLTEFRAVATEMVRLMDAATDLLKSPPKSYAESVKKLRAELWQGRLDRIASAVASLP